jgi:ubiquitin carboxyl-terminal hydrolase 8
MLDPPKLLIINLKRVAHGSFGFVKNSKRVQFPLILSLDEFMIHKIEKTNQKEIDAYSSAKEEDHWVPRYQYRLYGVVCHSGSMGGGHYVAYTCYEYQG